jgi:hypothetical protein
LKDTQKRIKEKKKARKEERNKTGKKRCAGDEMNVNIKKIPLFQLSSHLLVLLRVPLRVPLAWPALFCSKTKQESDIPWLIYYDNPKMTL